MTAKKQRTYLAHECEKGREYQAVSGPYNLRKYDGIRWELYPEGRWGIPVPMLSYGDGITGGWVSAEDCEWRFAQIKRQKVV